MVFWGVLKPGHRCARIDDLASDVYSAIEYILMLTMVRLELVNSFLSNYYGHACTHSITKKKIVKALSMHTGA